MKPRTLKYYLAARACAEPGAPPREIMLNLSWFWERYNGDQDPSAPLKEILDTFRRLHRDSTGKATEEEPWRNPASRAHHRIMWRAFARSLTALRNLDGYLEWSGRVKVTHAAEQKLAMLPGLEAL